MWTWLKDKWNRFHNWCATIAPGVKTFLVTSLGAVSTAAAAGQQYVSGLPLSTFLSAETALFIAAGLFTVAFWTRWLTNRS